MIESSSNNTYKYLRSLANKKYRDASKVFLVEGTRFIKEIPEKWEIEFFAVSESYSDENSTISLKERANVHIFSNSLFKKICETENSQGVLAVCLQKQVEFSDFVPLDKKGFYLLCEDINDPGNLGTIIRTADAAGVSAVFLSRGCVDLYNTKVLRSTMGSVFNVPVYQNVDLQNLILNLKEVDTAIFAAHLKGEVYHYDYNFKESCAFVVGNEARGISESLALSCDQYVKIPIVGKTESLNASIAAGIIIYEVLRQRMQ